MNRVHSSTSAEETIAIGRKLAEQIKGGAFIALHGDLGAGKTTLIKGLAAGLCGQAERGVNSPTFTYLHIYPGIVPLFHFDLYRIKDEEQFLQLGFLDYFEAGGVCCVEWAERIPTLLPEKRINITICHTADGRDITVDGL